MLKQIKDEARVTSLDEYVDFGTHWIALDILNIKIIYFGSFGVGPVPNEIKNFIRNKNIKQIYLEYKQTIQ